MNAYRKCRSAIVLFCGLSASAVADSPGLGAEPMFSAVISGDFEVAGSSIASARGSTLQPGDPVNLSLTIPQGASVVAAFANWTYLTTAPEDAVLRSIVINGTPVPDSAVTLVQSTTDDVCHLQDAPVVGLTATYFADVTGIVAFFVLRGACRPVGFMLEPSGKSVYDRIRCRGQSTVFRCIRMVSKTRGT